MKEMAVPLAALFLALMGVVAFIPSLLFDREERREERRKEQNAKSF